MQGPPFVIISNEHIFHPPESSHTEKVGHRLRSGPTRPRYSRRLATRSVQRLDCQKQTRLSVLDTACVSKACKGINFSNHPWNDGGRRQAGGLDPALTMNASSAPSISFPTRGLQARSPHREFITRAWRAPVYLRLLWLPTASKRAN